MDTSLVTVGWANIKCMHGAQHLNLLHWVLGPQVNITYIVNFRLVVGKRNIQLQSELQVHWWSWLVDSNRLIKNAETCPSANLIAYFWTTNLNCTICIVTAESSQLFQPHSIYPVCRQAEETVVVLANEIRKPERQLVPYCSVQVFSGYYLQIHGSKMVL